MGNEETKGRIVMAASNDLLTDQRVERHRRTLTEAGYDVVVLGKSDLPTRHPRGWRFYLELNLALRQKIATVATPTIIWANDTDTLLGCYLAARQTNAKLVLDCHELFPEVPEIQHKPLVKWVWRTLERWLMPKCDALFTVCDSIAEHYRLHLGVSMSVVRNLPNNEEGGMRNEDFACAHGNSSFPIPHSSVAILLYQGRVNLGRGVDWAIDALQWLPDCQLVVAGDGDLLEAMKAYAASRPWADRVTFTGRLTPEEMHALTPKADVGLVMLEDIGLSYHYALPNRIGDMVQAGVPMVVSDLPEMSAVVHRFGIGEVIREPGAKALADSIGKVLARGKESYDFTAARKDMDWNKEKNILLDRVNAMTPGL